MNEGGRSKKGEKEIIQELHLPTLRCVCPACYCGSTLKPTRGTAAVIQFVFCEGVRRHVEQAKTTKARGSECVKHKRIDGWSRELSDCL